jgi:hypothetical protein
MIDYGARNLLCIYRYQGRKADAQLECITIILISAGMNANGYLFITRQYPKPFYYSDCVTVLKKSSRQNLSSKPEISKSDGPRSNKCG